MDVQVCAVYDPGNMEESAQNDHLLQADEYIAMDLQIIPKEVVLLTDKAAPGYDL